jgi:sialic acid synthase SpsE
MPKFIAEVSSNHQKDIDRCIQFIETAAACGCDAVKFQLFRIEQLFAPEVLAKSAMHRERKKWELPLEFLPIISSHCKKNDIQFGCTPFYLDGVEHLKPHVSFYKIASYELLWDDLLAACAATGRPVILSTGMSTIPEIEHAITVLRQYGCLDITVLHCTSAYPTPFAEANLAAIGTIREKTGCNTGWSDHTVEHGVIFRSIYKWDADVIEFHLDLDGQGDEFVSGHCWLPEKIKLVIEQVRRGIIADGSGVKVPTQSELDDRMWRADPVDGLRPLKQIRGQFA